MAIPLPNAAASSLPSARRFAFHLPGMQKPPEAFASGGFLQVDAVRMGGGMVRVS